MSRDETKRITLVVPSDLHRKFKGTCGLVGKDMSVVGAELLRQWTENTLNELGMNEDTNDG